MVAAGLQSDALKPALSEVEGLSDSSPVDLSSVALAETEVHLLQRASA